MTSILSRYKFTAILASLAMMLVLAVVLLPWKLWIEARLKGMLEAQGLTHVQFMVPGIGLHNISLQDIRIGDAPFLLLLKNITLEYSLRDLLEGKIHDLTLTKLALEAHLVNNIWRIAGLEGGQSSSHTGDVSLPVTQDQLVSLPLHNMTLESSYLHVASDPWQLDVPLELVWQLQPVPTLTYHAAGSAFTSPAVNITTGDSSLKASLKAEQRQWLGQWRIGNIHITGTETPIPILNGSGNAGILSNQIQVDGQFVSADQTYKIVFRVHCFLNSPAKSELTMIDLTMPWYGGILSAQHVDIPFQGDRPIDVNLKIQHVSANALIQQLTGEKGTATGAISGILPLTLETDGHITVHQGTLKSEGAGLIKMSPDVIPGDNEQVALVRDVLRDFHYTLLALHVTTDKSNQLKMVMALEGRNPNASAGRPVKMSVNLTGDVLNFLQQNLLWLTHPKKFLEQGNK